MSSIKLTLEEQNCCHQIAKDSIRYGLEHGEKLVVEANDYSGTLKQKLASFVTLHINEALRGCIGTLEAYQPLVNDIAEHAYAAAFRDPRFPVLSQVEFDLISIEISVLGQAETMHFENQADLLEQLQPGIDGLILESGFNKGTFLPSVWEQLPGKQEFLNHLKMKAGLSAGWWDDAVKISRYETFSF